MLPCNVIVQETPDGEVKLAAIDPVAAMQAVDNPALLEIAEIIWSQLNRAIQNA
jgi:uncharacterized protein (DUF302 family)